MLTHDTLTETLSSYAYALNNIGSRTVLTETLLIPESRLVGASLEEDGLVVMEAENVAQVISGANHTWQLKTTQSGYTGTAYLQVLPDLDTLYATTEITASPALRYLVEFSTPGTYTVWLRGYASNATGDSAYVGLGQQVVNVTGFAPRQWEWAGGTEMLVEQSGSYTLSLLMREDGLRVDRVMLTTDTTYLPAGYGPTESARQTDDFSDTLTTLARTITYEYDDLYHLAEANYTTDELYQYTYDPVGNRLQQIINGQATAYTYNAANRLASVNGAPYIFDANGNLLSTGAMTNTWDAANRLIASQRNGAILQPIYDGVGNRVGQVKNGITTTFALDVAAGLPEVIYTNEDNAYLHLPGVIVAENAAGERRYLLADGLGSIRQAVDENGAVVAYNEFDPYGNPVENGDGPYGYTGEWWEDEVGLLYLRARWYAPETGTFLSVDPIESEPPYLYVRGNPVNLADPTGYFPEYCRRKIDRDAYAQCLLNYYFVLPVGWEGSGGFKKMFDVTQVRGRPHCWSGPVPYKGAGYLEGVVGAPLFTRFGSEIVYDFATMERRPFMYGGGGAANAYDPGFSAAAYWGRISGFKSNGTIEGDYGAEFLYVSAGFTPAGVTTFSAPDFSIWGYATYIGFHRSLFAGFAPGPEWDAGLTYYRPIRVKEIYIGEDEKVDRTSLVKDILSGDSSPVPVGGWWMNFFSPILSNRLGAVTLAIRYAIIHDAIYVHSRQ